MMFNEKMVVCLKANGKVLREFKDTVYVGFGNEYSILIKNLNTVRALVNITIDGQEVCPDGLVVNANSEIDLERFVKNGNLSSGNRFKFIERTAGIEKHRGIKADDGIVRVSFRYEKPRPLFVTGQWNSSSTLPGYYPPGVRSKDFDWPSAAVRNPALPWSTSAVGSMHDSLDMSSIAATKGILRGTTKGGKSETTFGATAVNQVTQCSTSTYSAPANDVGITVPGSVSNQKFSTTTMGAMESEEHVIILHLLGVTPDNKPVLDPVTVTSKTKCVTCGIQNKRTAKFCSNCGTSLTIIT